jgi:CelD/BcsL family acetyltransferase involved in cellulose biosynthesis
MESSGPEITIRPVQDFEELARLWRDLEARADGSFFQSWAWTGCLASERFSAPWLLAAHRKERLVALALFNRRSRRLLPTLHLGEAGRPDIDSIFIEHNGVLIDRSEPAETQLRCWASLAESKLGRTRWVISGVPSELAKELSHDRVVRITASRPAPYCDFTALPAGGGSVLDHLSGNTRQQLRRSLRAWKEIGPLRLDIASPGDEATTFFDGLKALHQRYWIGRGKPGAFAHPVFERFHQTLLDRAGPGQSIDLMRISAGSQTVGYLYNLVHRGWVAAYQSGIDYGPDADRLRPGLICHLLAIDHYRRAGNRLYDFLGGDARYKRSFASADRELLWLEARPSLVRLCLGRKSRSGSEPEGFS